MKSTRVSRRGVLNDAVGLEAGVTLVAALPARTAGAATACSGFSREEFLKYVTLFNANDPGFLHYYHDDVVF